MAAHKMFIVGEAGSSPPGHEVTATNLGQNQVSTLRGGGDMFYYEPAWPGKQTPLSALGPLLFAVFEFHGTGHRENSVSLSSQNAN